MEPKTPIVYSDRSYRLSKTPLIILIIYLLFAEALLSTVSAHPPEYGPYFQIPTGCGDKMAVAQEMIEGTEWPQDANWQNKKWKEWKVAHPGLQDSDRLGPATGAYNCVSYIFNNSQYWIPAPSRYKGTNPGCYIEDPNGTIRSNDLLHSCTVDYVGKCGNGFLQKRNDLVYGPVFPIYRKITKVNTVLTIDRSGSMASSGYIGPAKNSAKMFVDLMKPWENIGVVSFNGTSTVNYSITTIDAEGSVKTAAKNAISAISAEGVTTIGGGLSTAHSELMLIEPRHQSKTIVLLSDGEENQPPWVESVLPLVRDDNIRVYTISQGIQEVNEGLLKHIASETGGKFFRSPSSETLTEMYYNIATDLSGNKTVQTDRDTIQQSQIREHFVTVDSSMSDVDFTSMWQGSDIDVVLVPPGGGIIDPAEAATNEDIEYIEGDTYEFYRVAEPQPGQWLVRTTGVDIEPEGEPYTVSVSGYSRLGLSIDFNKHEYFPTHPMHVVAELSDSETVAGTNVTAVLTTPSSATHNLTLHDDGVHGDGAADDGVYGVFFTDTGQLGSYSLEVQASGTFNGGEPFTRTKTVATVVTLDSDADGMSDGWEDLHGLDKYQDDSAGDPDADGLTNLEEYLFLSDPQDADRDGDGHNDISEWRCGTDPFEVTDFPLHSDDDTMCDQWEIRHGADFYWLNDDDGDGIGNYGEYLLRSNPIKVDSDSDGLCDNTEFDIHGSAPGNADTDNDGLDDGDEIAIGTDPTDSDTDGDGMSDGWETFYGLNPFDNDAGEDPDGDGDDNGWEFGAGTVPVPPDFPAYINLGNSTSSGTNNTVEFVGYNPNSEKHLHSKATCRGNWTVTPCGWTSSCSTGWEYDPADIYEIADSGCSTTVVVNSVGVSWAVATALVLAMLPFFRYRRRTRKN